MNVDHAIYARRIDLNYRRRAKLLLVGLPSLLWFSLSSAVWSFFLQPRFPTVVVAGSHMQALVFLIFRTLFRRSCRIVLLGFIYTQRNSRVLRQLRRAYFRMLFSRIDQVICHSDLEVARYEREFCTVPFRFIFIPYGLHVENHEIYSGFVAPGSTFALSAGRSGRDYRTLCEAFREVGTPLHIVCDSKDALSGLRLSPNIFVLDHCYDSEYFDQLRDADLVVVPIAVTDISAGQMVVIQAMALRKAIVVTRTVTLDHYVRDGWNAIIVEPGDSASLVNAVRRLQGDSEFAESLGSAAYMTFLESYSMPAFVRQIVLAVLK